MTSRTTSSQQGLVARGRGRCLPRGGGGAGPRSQAGQGGGARHPSRCASSIACAVFITTAWSSHCPAARALALSRRRHLALLRSRLRPARLLRPHRVVGRQPMLRRWPRQCVSRCRRPSPREAPHTPRCLLSVPLCSPDARRHRCVAWHVRHALWHHGHAAPLLRGPQCVGARGRQWEPGGGDLMRAGGAGVEVSGRSTGSCSCARATPALSLCAARSLCQPCGPGLLHGYAVLQGGSLAG